MANKLLDKLLSKIRTSESELPAEKAGSRPAQRASRSDVDQFLAQLKQMPRAAGSGRLIFALDATASRQATWNQASELQAQMFNEAKTLGGLAVQLCYFRGFREFYTSPWHSDSAELLATMQGLRCEAGMTQIASVLKHALDENAQRPLSGVVFIGDCLEEGIDTLAESAGKLGLLRVPVFMFQEGNDSVAQRGFGDIARLSGGAHGRFDSGSAAQLRSLLRAVAAYAAGGTQGLAQLGRRDAEARQAVALLTQQLR